METIYRRVVGLKTVLVAAWLLLGGRYAYLSIIRGEEFHDMARQNKTRYVRIYPRRGRILTSDGEIIAGSRIGYHMDMYGADKYTLERLRVVVEHVLPQRSEELERRIAAVQYHAPYLPYPVFHNLNPEELAILEGRRYDFPGFYFRRSLTRYYPQGVLFAHASGYVGDPTPNDLENRPGIKPGDILGKVGLERKYDSTMRGRVGEWLVTVDATEREITRFMKKPDQPGKDLRVTLDSRLQREAFDLMAGRPGAVVAMTTEGRILVYLSSPSYDVNGFREGFTRSEWQKIRTDPNRPLMDRCAQGLYPPGSLVKPFIALMARNSGIIPGTGVLCTGEYRFGDHTYRCWKRGGHGKVDLQHAIEESCDVYFYTLARTNGIAVLSDWLRSTGWGASTSVDLPFEEDGLVPDEAWSLQVRHQPWIAGETISVGIGQGPILTTPLQIATLYAALASGGRIPEPAFNRGLPVHSRRIPASTEAFTDVQTALAGVVSAPWGSAHAIDGIPTIAGKTGTAQVMREIEGRPYRREHSWFAGYGPVEEPRVVICVLVENAGHGSEVAAPIAAKILRLALEVLP